MLLGKLVFAQLMSHLPLQAFGRMVKTHHAEHKVKDFSCLDQFLVLAFAQLTGRQSLRDIQANLRVHSSRLYHLGFRCKTISRNTLANANLKRPWQVFADLAQHLIGIARALYVDDLTSVELQSVLSQTTIYALDSTTIDLCLSLFAWAPFRQTKAAIKLHTLLDLRGSIPSFIHISDGLMHDVNVLDLLANQGYIEAGAFYVMDKAYVDFARLHTLHQARAFFVTRAKVNIQAQVIETFSVDTSTGLVSDVRIKLTGIKSAKRFPDCLRCVVYTDPESGKMFTFLTNNSTLPAATICLLYKHRWQVELFFRWIKQHLKIKAFLGTSENAVKTQVWIAIATYVLIAIVKKRLKLQQSLHQILYVLELAMFETTPIPELFGQIPNDDLTNSDSIQLNLFSTLGQ